MTTISYLCPGEQSHEWSREREVGVLFLPETRRLADVVTRAAQGVLGVATGQDGHIPHVDGSQGVTIADSIVTLSIEPPSDGGVELRLLPGEARSLAAILTRDHGPQRLRDRPRDREDGREPGRDRRQPLARQVDRVA